MGGQLQTTVQSRCQRYRCSECLTSEESSNGQPLHTVEVLGDLQVNATYTLVVDAAERAKIIKNHTTTHYYTKH